MPTLTEHTIKIPIEPLNGDVNTKMKVFYNPVMASNRNISILLLNSVENTQMNVCDPLAGSGIRSLRFLKELKKGKIKQLYVNDMKENFKEVFSDGLKLNKLKPKNVSLFNQDANLFLQEQIGFDYIDIDPFGSPNPFLALAVARISRGGIIAVTATDTAALTGTYPKVTPRKYWAVSLKNYLMHEIGLRILIRKVQLQGIQFDKAFIPVLAYSKDHYFRVYFRNEKGMGIAPSGRNPFDDIIESRRGVAPTEMRLLRLPQQGCTKGNALRHRRENYPFLCRRCYAHTGKEKCDELIKQHQYFLYCNNCLNFKTSIFNKEKCTCGKEFTFAGPLWIGKLSDEKLLETMVENNPFPEEQKLLELLLGEAKVNQVGFYDLHEIARKLKKDPSKMELALKKLKGVRTHFSLTGIKSEKKIT